MLKDLDGRDLVMNDGKRIALPDGTTANRASTGAIWLTAYAEAGTKTVKCELPLGSNEQYVRFVLDHMANELKGYAPRNQGT